MNWNSASSIVTEALWVRRWALELLSGTEPSARVIDHVNRAGEFALRLVFGIERCAIALRSQLALRSLELDLSEPVVRVLDEFRVRELKRALSVRAQLEQIAEIAKAQRKRLVVLKGGVAIAEGRYLDAADVDVLAHQGEAAALAEELASREPHVVIGRDVPFSPRGPKHMAKRLAENSVQVEIHYSVNGLGPGDVLLPRAEPLEAIPGLHRLGAEDHLFHLLYHTSVSHPDRAGRLRDLLLIADASRSLREDQTRAVVRRLAAIPAAGSAQQVLTAAGTLVRGKGTDGDPFTAVASANYLLWSLAKLNRRPIGPQVFASVFHLVGGYGEYARWVVRSLSAPDAPSRHALFRRLVGWSPVLSRTLRGASRPPRIAAGLPLALRLSRQAKRLAALWEREKG